MKIIETLKHNWVVWRRSKRKVTVEVTGHAVGRFRKRFLKPADRDVLAKDLKSYIYSHTMDLYLNNSLSLIGPDKYSHKDETWVLIIKDLKTHIKIKVITCWKDI